MNKKMIVGITGASGVVYGVRLVESLLHLGHEVSLVISDAGKLVIREETGKTVKSSSHAEDYAHLFGKDNISQLSIYSSKDFTASIASGSYPMDAMVVIPCSMGTLGAIANGLSQNLIHRAADCILKESKRLVLVPRETPLSQIHLENMLKLSRAGAKMVPAMPGFYSGPQNLDEMINFMVGKVLDQLEITHMLYPRWTGLAKKS